MYMTSTMYDSIRGSLWEHQHRNGNFYVLMFLLIVAIYDPICVQNNPALGSQLEL